MDNDGSGNSTDVPLRPGYLSLPPFVHNIETRAAAQGEWGFYAGLDRGASR